MIINAGTFVMLTQAYSAAFDRGFKGFGVDQDWDKVASLETSGTATGVYPWIGNFTKMREWLGDRIVKNFQQYGYSLKNRKFEATVEVPRIAIEDDQYGVYAKAFTQAGMSVKVWPDDLVFGGDAIYTAGNETPNIGGAAIEGTVNLCYDGQPFFNNSHPVTGQPANADLSTSAGYASNYDSNTGTINNTGGHLWMLIDNSKGLMPFLFQLRSAPVITPRMLDTDPAVFDRDAFTWGIRARGAAGYGFWQTCFGSVNDLTVANFRTYRKQMETLRTDQGFMMGVTPKLLVCGPALKSAAKDLLKRQLIPDPTDSHAAATSNAEYEAVDLLVTPHLP
jgi:phage major head subunit gpT-like protein